MKTVHVIIPLYPSVADPSFEVRMCLVQEDGELIYFGKLGWWRQFILWALRRHIRGLE